MLQGKHCSSTERLVKLYSLTVVIYSGIQKEVALLCTGTKHCKLNLIIVTVQLDSGIVNFKAIAFLGSDGIIYTEISVTVWVFDPSVGEVVISVTQPSGVTVSHRVMHTISPHLILIGEPLLCNQYVYTLTLYFSCSRPHLVAELPLNVG